MGGECLNTKYTIVVSLLLDNVTRVCHQLLRNGEPKNAPDLWTMTRHEQLSTGIPVAHAQQNPTTPCSWILGWLVVVRISPCCVQFVRSRFFAPEQICTTADSEADNNGWRLFYGLFVCVNCGTPLLDEWSQ